MQINKFSKAKNGMYNLLLDNSMKLTIHENLILKYDLLIKKSITEKEKEKLIEENKIYEIYELSLSYINKKLRSKKELYKYLENKGYSKDYIDQTVEVLYKEGYLNDTIYANSYVHDRINLSMDGPNKIRKELESNNIDNNIIEEALIDYNKELESERIEKIVTKQIKLNNNKGANLLKRKIQIYLLNLGYDYDLINNNLNSKQLVSEEIYKKEYDKLYKQLSKKYSGNELEYRLKQKLYQKGFYQD